MQNSGLAITRSDSCFFYTRPVPDQKSNFLFHKPVFLPPNRVGSLRLRAKAAFNDGVAAMELKELTFYELLGIPESGSVTQIKQAYKQLARKYHPDVSPPGRVKEYTEKFIRVQEAYETLSDSRRRALYDRDMAKGLHLAFSARRCQYDEGVEAKGDWKNRWQTQLSELMRRSMNKDASEHMSWSTYFGVEEKGDWKNRWQTRLSELMRRSMNKDAREHMSWGARMRRRREGSSDQL